MPSPSPLISAIGALVIWILCAPYLQLARRPKDLGVKGFAASFGVALGAIAWPRSDEASGLAADPVHVLRHDHPSGIPRLSAADLGLTARLRELAAELDRHLLHHLIIARGRFGSMEDYWRAAQWRA